MRNETDRRAHPSRGPYKSPGEAAEYLGVSRRTVYRWIDEGRLTAYELGDPAAHGRGYGMKRLRVADLDRLVRARRAS